MEDAGGKWPADAIYGVWALSIGTTENAARLITPDGLVRRIRIAYLQFTFRCVNIVRAAVTHQPM